MTTGNVTLEISYGGIKPNDTYTVIASHQTVWDVLVEALGKDNLQFDNYPTLGNFITGLNGITAQDKQFYEFRVNGIVSEVGVSKYICKPGDKIDFILTTLSSQKD